jgi:hypothetical protein
VTNDTHSVGHPPRLVAAVPALAEHACSSTRDQGAKVSVNVDLRPWSRSSVSYTCGRKPKLEGFLLGLVLARLSRDC